MLLSVCVLNGFQLLVFLMNILMLNILLTTSMNYRFNFKERFFVFIFSFIIVLVMKKVHFDSKPALLPKSVTSVEQKCITVSDIENGIYTPSVHGDFVDAEEDYIDDYDEACDLTNDLDNNFEADILEDINRSNDKEVKDDTDE